MVGDSSDDSAPLPPSTSSDAAVVAGTAGRVEEAALDLGYTVTVDSFSGPLDLLLYLVRRTELDILEVPLSLIVDQFVDTVRSWQDADLDVAGEFILMAATLLEFKARTIAPPLDQPEEGAEDEPMFDPRESLLRSLLAYRRFKEAAQGLGELEELRRPLLERQFREHVPEAPPEDSDIDLGEIDLSLLATTCERVLSRIGGLGPRTVMVDEMPLGVRIATMLDELSVRERATMSDLLAGNHSRVVHITTVMATLELTRQRFIEVEQPEQFGEIALRLRSAEEREREPQLPPPEPDGPKRRRRLPLVTYTAPSSTESVTSEDDTVDATPEEPAENDEQRFLRELEEATHVTAVLAITANVEKSFTEHWYTLHPELRPVVAPPPPAPAPAEPVAKRFPPRRSTPPPTAPVNEPPTVPVADTVPAAETPAGTMPSADPVVAVDLVPTSVPTSVPAEATVVAPAVVESPVPAEPAAVQVEPVAAITSTAEPLTSAISDVPAVVETPAAVVSADAVSPEPVSTAEPAATVASTAPVESPISETPPSETPASPLTHDLPASISVPTPVPTEQHVLPVEQWPVLHALPAPEETPNPLDTISSDDPAAINALFSGETPRAPRSTEQAEEAEDDDEETDPDDLLADDPALVNAALQAATPRPPVERKPVHDLTIPVATETSVWTAPVDRGQTAAEVADDEIASSAAAATSAAENPPVIQSTPSADVPTAEQPTVEPEIVATQSTPSAAVPTAEQLTVEPEITASPVAPPMAAEFVPARAPLSEPTPTTAPLILPDTAADPLASPTSPTSSSIADDLEPDDQEAVEGMNANDPALVEAALQADSPRASITLHPAHDLTIPTATDTSVWTAPVDRGQTAAEVDDEPDIPTASAADEAAGAADEAAGAADEAAGVADDAATSDVVEVMAVKAPVTLDVADAIAPLVSSAALAEPVPAISEPTPTTAPLVLPERTADAGTPQAAVEIVTSAPVETPAARVDDHAVTETPPPPEDGPPPVTPPPPPPPPPPRSDSPLPAPTTTPTPKRPMSPPPRSKAWLLIAIVIAIVSNAGWALGTWLTWVPREVLEVAATEQGGNDEHPTLVWRFNLDVVDALAQAKPPELVPVITPALSGRWVWSDPRTLVFEAAAPLPLATTFSATLPHEDFHTVQGFRLRAPRTHTWSTPALAISGAAVVETFDRDGTTIALTFTQPVDPLVIARQLMVELPVGEVVTTTTPAVAPTPPVAAPSLTTPSDPAATVTDSVPAAAAPVADAAVVDAAVVDAPVADAPVVAAPVTTEPAPVVDQSATRTPSVSVDAKIVDLTAESLEELGINALPTVATATSEIPSSAPVLQVRAITTEPATTIRLVLATRARGRATLRLPAGTTGVDGPLGLAQAWEQQVALQQTLVLTTASAQVPSHGDVRVDVAVSDPAAPRELLAPVVSVDPPVPVTVSTTDQGVSLIGPFVPGQSYRIAITSTWPTEPTTSGHVLAAYTAASAVSITIPERPAGIWPLEHHVIDGSQRLAAHAVSRADVMLLTVAEDECVASRELTWTTPGAAALLDLDDLTQDQPAGQYRLRIITDEETPVISDQTLVIENLRVRPYALVAALSDWLLAGLAGDDHADVLVRAVRIR